MRGEGRGERKEMANAGRVGTTGRFVSRKLSPLTFSLYIIVLFGLSVFLFFFYSKDVLEDERTRLFFDDSTPKIQRSEPIANEKLWDWPHSHGLHACIKPTTKYKAAQESSHYITVKSNGGLNQMRTGIADMVAVARIMNATLVIPQLDKRSFWQDSSTFSDIFDETHFIESLHQDVRIVKELPKTLVSVPRARKHFTSWAGISYYVNMTHLWNEYQAIHVAKSDSRLANNDLPLDIQRLRCRALYLALRFSTSIENLGKASGAATSTYEKDMLSFTGCTYGLSAAEAEELRIMRENTNHWKIKNMDPTEQRNAGLCPLTPKEVGIFLRALGYPPSTLIYIAAGEIYGGQTHLSELTARFPNVVFKETLATRDELRVFAKHATQNAALDYIISLESDLFVPTHSGNMARALEGHRRFLDHRKTITPDRKGLVPVFDRLELGEIEEGKSLSRIIKKMHIDRQGAPRKRFGSPPGIKGRARFRYEESFYENPFPECICNS
ncbi:hypothetical protein V2J09_009860 [Rumex salicifolius]